jgi:hypothetical protein
MNQSALYNYSGRTIPENARITISGKHKLGDVLVIESFDGTDGNAQWRNDAELTAYRADREKTAVQPNSHPVWPPPLKPRAPYS